MRSSKIFCLYHFADMHVKYFEMCNYHHPTKKLFLFIYGGRLAAIFVGALNIEDGHPVRDVTRFLEIKNDDGMTLFVTDSSRYERAYFRHRQRMDALASS